MREAISGMALLLTQPEVAVPVIGAEETAPADAFDMLSTRCPTVGAWMLRTDNPADIYK